MSDEKLPVIAIPYVQGGQCDLCELRTPQLYALHRVVQDYPNCLCGWCLVKARWIADHASALAPSWPAPDEESAP